MSLEAEKAWKYAGQEAIGSCLPCACPLNCQNYKEHFLYCEYFGQPYSIMCLRSLRWH